MAIPSKVGSLIDSVVGDLGKNTEESTTPSAATAASYTAIPSSGLTPQGIADIYNTLAPMAGDYANANIERAGQAQASYGALAAAAMGNSRTAGIGNYTYNRLARPAVDSMRNELVVQGLSDALNKQLNDSLRQAQENYNRAARRHSLKGSGGGSGGGTTTTTGGSTWDGEIETDAVDEGNPTKHTNKGNYVLFYVVSPDGTRTQWKMFTNLMGIPTGYDTPMLSYEAGAGSDRLRSLVGQGYKIIGADGSDMTSRWR